MAPDISFNEPLFHMSNGISKRKDLTLRSMWPHKDARVCANRMWRAFRGNWLYALPWGPDPHHHQTPTGGNVSKVTKLEGGEAEVQTHVHLTQNPMHNAFHYMCVCLCVFSTNPLCSLTDLHACLFGDNASGIIIIITRTVTTKSTGESL